MEDQQSKLIPLNLFNFPTFNNCQYSSSTRQDNCGCQINCKIGNYCPTLVRCRNTKKWDNDRTGHTPAWIIIISDTFSTQPKQSSPERLPRSTAVSNCSSMDAALGPPPTKVVHHSGFTKQNHKNKLNCCLPGLPAFKVGHH